MIVVVAVVAVDGIVSFAAVDFVAVVADSCMS